jgi:ATP-dependent helicase/nuclease subunit A
MNETVWTPEQLEAITDRGCNMLVAAAAGAGKTAVLVERIIRRITDQDNPTDIDRLLVVTFTNAAAAEMRERIGRAIEQVLEKNPGNRQLQRQLALLNRARITTIHSFCLDVIRNNFHSIDLDPGFRIADDTEAVLIKAEVIEQLFDDAYMGSGLKYSLLPADDGHESDDSDPEFLKLVECYGGSRDDRKLQDMVLNIHRFVQSHPWPKQWLRQKAEEFNIEPLADFGTTAWANTLIEAVSTELKGIIRSLEQAAELARRSEGLGPYLECLTGDIIRIEGILRNSDKGWDQLYHSLSGFEFDKLPRCGKGADGDARERVKAIRDQAKNGIKRIRDRVVCVKSEDIIKDIRELYPVIRRLAELVIEFERRYADVKRERLLLDFNDIEHLCLEILTEPDGQGGRKPSDIALKYRDWFDEILVDEYQDSNLIQEVILNTISKKDGGGPNVFVVGDVKQSIYRFRQARPELFLEKYHSYQREKGSNNRKIQLYKNFRSREGIIDAVNFVFGRIMSRDAGELDYTSEEELNFGADYPDAQHKDRGDCYRVELHLLETGDRNGSGEPESVQAQDRPEEGESYDEPDAIQAEARMVAKRIKDLVGCPQSEAFKVYDAKLNGYRNIEYRDIVILMRATKNWADVFAQELADSDIPVYADTGVGFFRTSEIQVMTALLQIIDNPMQDIPLLAVLRSPIASFTADELADIRLHSNDRYFYLALKRFAEQDKGPTGHKAAHFLDNLDQWRNASRFMAIDELIWHLYAQTGYYSFVGTMPGGIQRQANLRALFERAGQFEKTSYRGLFNFINFIDKLKGSSGDMDSAKVLGESENVVRIMSIHKSKGLEFPVVIVAGCGKGFNLQDLSADILLHHDLGFGPDYVDHTMRISYPTVPKEAIKYRIKAETLSEEMRILYVAFTRAKEKLIITGSVKDIKKSSQRWARSIPCSEERMPGYEALAAGCFLDWIGPALMRHRDGQCLKDAAEVESGAIGGIINDKSCWSIKLWTRDDLTPGQIQPDLQKTDNAAGIPVPEQNVPDVVIEEIDKRLGWKYTYAMSGRLPTKVSVTELKRRAQTELAEEYVPAQLFERPLIRKPLFVEGTGRLSAAERGTVMHCVMQHIDLERVGSLELIKGQVFEMIDRELLTKAEADSIDIPGILGFFRSPLGCRMLNSPRVEREVPFNLELKCTDLFSDLPGDIYRDETVLLQGIIDCYFEEDGDIVMLDYKTDHVRQGQEQSILDKYRDQIRYYTLALERITGKRVKSRYIYLFGSGMAVELPALNGRH